MENFVSEEAARRCGQRGLTLGLEVLGASHANKNLVELVSAEISVWVVFERLELDVDRDESLVDGSECELSVYDPQTLTELGEI